MDGTRHLLINSSPEVNTRRFIISTKQTCAHRRRQRESRYAARPPAGSVDQQIPTLFGVSVVHLWRRDATRSRLHSNHDNDLWVWTVPRRLFGLDQTKESVCLKHPADPEPQGPVPGLRSLQSETHDQRTEKQLASASRRERGLLLLASPPPRLCFLQYSHSSDV